MCACNGGGGSRAAISKAPYFYRVTMPDGKTHDFLTHPQAATHVALYGGHLEAIAN